MTVEECLNRLEQTEHEDEERVILREFYADARAEPLEVLRRIVLWADTYLKGGSACPACKDFPIHAPQCPISDARALLADASETKSFDTMEELITDLNQDDASATAASTAGANAPEQTEPTAKSMHIGGVDYIKARARNFVSLEANCDNGGVCVAFYMGHDEGFNLGLSVASVNRLVAAHEPHLKALRDATAAVRDRVNEPTAMEGEYVDGDEVNDG